MSVAADLLFFPINISQVAGIISGILVLIVTLAVGYLLEPLPKVIYWCIYIF